MSQLMCTMPRVQAGERISTLLAMHPCQRPAAEAALSACAACNLHCVLTCVRVKLQWGFAHYHLWFAYAISSCFEFQLPAV